MNGIIRRWNGCTEWDQKFIWPSTVPISSQNRAPREEQDRHVITLPPSTFPASTNLSLEDCLSQMMFMYIWEVVQASLEPIKTSKAFMNLSFLITRSYSLVVRQLKAHQFICFDYSQMHHLNSYLNWISWDISRTQWVSFSPAMCPHLHCPEKPGTINRLPPHQLLSLHFPHESKKEDSTSLGITSSFKLRSQDFFLYSTASFISSEQLLARETTASFERIF